MCNFKALWIIETMGGFWRKADESFEEKEYRIEKFLKNRNTNESFEGKKNLKAC
jgi:hypothetical protein